MKKQVIAVALLLIGSGAVFLNSAIGTESDNIKQSCMKCKGTLVQGYRLRSGVGDYWVPGRINGKTQIYENKKGHKVILYRCSECGHCEEYAN